MVYAELGRINCGRGCEIMYGRGFVSCVSSLGLSMGIGGFCMGW